MKQKKKIKKVVKPVIKHKYIKLALVFILLIGLIIVTALGVWNIFVNMRYSSYKEKMEWYGFDNLYNNEKATSTEKVYKSEIAKLTLGVVLNVTDVDFASKYLKNQYEKTYETNFAWLEYANYYDIKGINQDEFEEKASKLDAAIYLVQVVEEFLDKEIEVTEELKKNLVEKVDKADVENINKAISIGILKNSSADITDDTLRKGEFNKMLITVVEKYNTVYFKALYNLNKENISVVLDKEKLPNNYEMYPYVLDNVDKSIYEITTDAMISSISEAPKEVYKTYKEEYFNTNENVTDYFDIILNVDYKTINKEKFINMLNGYVVYNLKTKINDEFVYKGIVEDYVDYVIENKIVLQGKATPLLPIIYSNGLLHFLRTKIEFTIVNSNTKENLLLWDNNTVYNGKSIEVYVDVPVSPTYYSKAFRIYNSYSLMSQIVKNDGNVEVK